MRTTLLVCLLMADAGGAIAQMPRLVDKVEKKGDELVIPYNSLSSVGPDYRC